MSQDDLRWIILNMVCSELWQFSLGSDAGATAVAGASLTTARHMGEVTEPIGSFAVGAFLQLLARVLGSTSPVFISGCKQQVAALFNSLYVPRKFLE